MTIAYQHSIPSNLILKRYSGMQKRLLTIKTIYCEGHLWSSKTNGYQACTLEGVIIQYTLSWLPLYQGRAGNLWLAGQIWPVLVELPGLQYLCCFTQPDPGLFSHTVWGYVTLTTIQNSTVHFSRIKYTKWLDLLLHFQVCFYLSKTTEIYVDISEWRGVNFVLLILSTKT